MIHCKYSLALICLSFSFSFWETWFYLVVRPLFVYSIFEIDHPLWIVLCWKQSLFSFFTLLCCVSVLLDWGVKKGQRVRMRGSVLCIHSWWVLIHKDNVEIGLTFVRMYSTRDFTVERRVTQKSSSNNRSDVRPFVINLTTGTHKCQQITYIRTSQVQS